MEIEKTEGDTASKGSKSFPHIMAVKKVHLHLIPEKYKSVECIPQTELQNLHGTFYIYLIEQLQTMPYVFRMNGAQTYFGKQK